MKVWFNIPWSQEKNLGEAYNSFMETIGEDDYACFLDGDAMFLDPYFGRHIYNVIEKNPEAGVLTCKTNRIGCLWQREPGMWGIEDIGTHRYVAKNMQEYHGSKIQDVTEWGTDNPMGGVLILISKKAWKNVGGFADGMLGVDNKLHWSCIAKGERVFLMHGIYAYHYYRGGNAQDNKHLR